jgi:hypothetical protein
MKPVQRDEIVDYQTYGDLRPEFRKEAMAAKDARRVHIGDHLTLLFENRTTIRYQIQEMMRAEKIVKEKEIQHEIDTYNGLLGGDGELGCTLLIEIDDPARRDALLKEWFALPEHLYAKLPDGTKVRPTFDEKQRGRGRVSSVQYLKFPVGGRAPVALGVDLPGLAAESELSAGQRQALADDLG